MQFTDLIAGLAFVNGHIGLYRLDKGLRDGISIPMEQLQAHVQMLSRSAQIVTITNQIQQLKGEASKFKKQQLNAQHAQLMVQVGQLQLQLQQLQVERQHLELEVKKEQRLAQENQILRIFVDLYDQVQTYKQQGQLLDFVFVTVATLRIYRQIYSDLDDANNRLRISELKEKLFLGLRETLESPQNRLALASDYANALKIPIALLAKGQETNADAAQAISDVTTLRRPPDDGGWGQSITLADSYLAHLSNAKNTLAATRAEYAAFSQGLDTREFFFPAQGENVTALVAGMGNAWREWIGLAETNVNSRVVQIYNSLQEQPALFDKHEKEITSAAENAKQLRITHQIGHAAAFLAKAMPPLLERFRDLNSKAAEFPISKDEADPARVFDAYLALYQIKAALLSEFAPFQKYIKSNGNLSDSKYLSATSKRLREINAVEATTLNAQAANALKLSKDLTAVDSILGNRIKMGKSLLDKAVEADTSFEKLQSSIREIMDEPAIQGVEAQVAGQQPNTLGQVVSVFRSDRGKEFERRRRFIDRIVEGHLRAASMSGGELPGFEGAPAFLPLPEVKSGWLKF